MLYPATADHLHRRRLIVAGITIMLLIAVVTYAVLAHRADSPAAAPGDPGSDPVETPTVETARAVTELPVLRETSDPDAFARQVAEALFTWDTTTLVTRSDHIEQLVEVADPTGESTPGLVLDLDSYLPGQDAWVDLAKYQTRQWLMIDSVTTPSTWADARAQAGEALLPGTTARTIHGTRHRAGTWEGRDVQSEHAVAFTVFIVCGPTYPDCRLLRLSMLDKHLD